VAHQPNHRGRGEGEGPPLSVGGATIAAVSTPPGRGGIGVVRISGPHARSMVRAIAGREPRVREATLAELRARDGALIDRGIVIVFAAPHSYTGEDVVELQAHGGPLVLQQLLGRCVELGARLAEPGEFTRRAFLNGRIDLAQAESVADLIDASSVEAARSAARSLAGDFSRRVQVLVAGLITLRAHVEACIDFPEEEIDPADRASQRTQLAALRADLDELLVQARQGAVLRDGLTVVLIGRPNVGKSSLLNRLAGDDIAIVTPIAGTTRDHVRATLSLDGVPVHLIDTAGLREATDEIERIGIERTWSAVQQAGAALYLVDAADDSASMETAHLERLPAGIPIAHVVNKIDLTGASPGRSRAGTHEVLHVSALTGAGVDRLREWLLEAAGWQPAGEGLFMARARHLGGLRAAGKHLQTCAEAGQPIELMAEELRLAQQALSALTGEFPADELLGTIFSTFCIGK
jgi:tRNA modification GTPase